MPGISIAIFFSVKETRLSLTSGGLLHIVARRRPIFVRCGHLVVPRKVERSLGSLVVECTDVKAAFRGALLEEKERHKGRGKDVDFFPCRCRRSMSTAIANCKLVSEHRSL